MAKFDYFWADFERNIADKISKFGQEPSSASVTCAVTGPIIIKDAKKIRGRSGEDVFSEKRGLGFIKNKVSIPDHSTGFLGRE
jgi:catabolite regulation protein CreA